LYDFHSLTHNSLWQNLFPQLEQSDAVGVSRCNDIGVFAMPAKSKVQQRAAGAALSAKRGEAPSKSLKGASKEMFKSMTERQLEELAETRRTGLPQRVKK
jgi:Protein of unknwon function (DUF3008)